jgi:hypothetical protein
MRLFPDAVDAWHTWRREEEMWNVKILGRQLSCRIWRIAGALVLIAGVVGDCLAGFLLFSGGTCWCLFWHGLCALLWAWGVNLCAWRDEVFEVRLCILPNRWGLSALLLGLGAFPGLGLSACTLAFVLARYLFVWAACVDASIAEQEVRERWEQKEVCSLRQEPVLPFVDDMHEGNTEARRAVVAQLSRAANPGTTHLLRRLLCDTKAEIRCDASIALNSLEDKMAQELHQAFAAWRVNPTDIECALACIDHGYRYATSNVLDTKSQHLYLQQVHDRLQQVLACRGREDATLWVKLADVSQRLGQVPQALQAALQAVHLQPESSDTSLLAMDLAFRSHAWDILYSLAGQHTDGLPEVLPFGPGQTGTESCGPDVWEEVRSE